MKQALLHLKVVKMLAEGQLPPSRDATVVAGYGEGLACAVCDEPIAADQIRYELEDSTRGMLRMHVDCYRAWRGVGADTQAEHRPEQR